MHMNVAAEEADSCNGGRCLKIAGARQEAGKRKAGRAVRQVGVLLEQAWWQPRLGVAACDVGRSG